MLALIPTDIVWEWFESIMNKTTYMAILEEKIVIY